MSRAGRIAVGADEAGLRLDRWLGRRFPGVPHARLQKWLRTGQVRLDGRRVKAGARLEAGQTVRVPPVDDDAPEAAPRQPAVAVSADDGEEIRRRVLHMDARVLVIDKPAGLAVQGGTNVKRHLDAMLDELRFDADQRPRLVHRLDKDTSGVLLLARDGAAAAALSKAFRTGSVRKGYWAVVVGTPRPERGRIELPLAKVAGRRGEHVAPVAAGGRRAVTLYRVAVSVRQAAWLVLEPQTGRTHQLRAHCVSLGTPILGDGKYGGARAFVAGAGIGRGLHLHARVLRLAHPAGGSLEITAPLPPHMAETWRFLGFDGAGDPGAWCDRRGAVRGS